MKKAIKMSSLMGIAAVLFLAGCGGEKTAASAETFTATVEEHEFEVTDVTETEATDGAELILMAKDSNDSEIWFYDMSDVETADIFFDNWRQELEDIRDDSSSTLSREQSNSEKYTLTFDGKYHVLARVDDTVIFEVGDRGNAVFLQKMEDALGY